MRLVEEFDVSAPVDVVWSYLLDVEKVASCMPGAELTEIVDGETWKGRINVKFGPVALSFQGEVSMEQRDDIAHRVTLVARGQERKGKGAANAKVTSWLEDMEGGTKVRMEADLQLSGFVVQVSRGMLPDVSARMTRQFADCLGMTLQGLGQLSGEASVPPLTPQSGFGDAEPSAVPAVGGIRLSIWALFRSLARLFRRITGGFGRGSSS